MVESDPGRYDSEPSGQTSGESSGASRGIAAGGGLGPVQRFAVAVLLGLATHGLTSALLEYPLTARLELWSVVSLVSGLLLGPAGILGSSLAFVAANLSREGACMSH